MRFSAVPYALLLAGLLTAGAAQADAGAPSEQVWPVDCTRDVQRDGLVLIDEALGAVRVSLRPSSGDADLPGAFAATEQGVQVWQSAEPLLAQTEYRLELQPLAADGEPQGEPQVSHFTTGDALKAPLAAGGEPAARVLPHTAAAADAQLSVESQRDDVVVLRVALPGLTGGLSHRPVALHAALQGDVSSEQALGARVEEDQRAIPNQPVAFQLQAVLDDEPSERCVSIQAQQEFGALELPPFCVKLPARVQEASEPAHDDEEFAYAASVSADHSADGLDISQVVRTDAGGCSVGAQHPVRDGAWLLLALVPLLARRRRVA